MHVALADEHAEGTQRRGEADVLAGDFHIHLERRAVGRAVGQPPVVGTVVTVEEGSRIVGVRQVDADGQDGNRHDLHGQRADAACIDKAGQALRRSLLGKAVEVAQGDVQRLAGEQPRLKLIIHTVGIVAAVEDDVDVGGWHAQCPSQGGGQVGLRGDGHVAEVREPQQQVAFDVDKVGQRHVDQRQHEVELPQPVLDGIVHGQRVRKRLDNRVQAENALKPDLSEG